MEQHNELYENKQYSAMIRMEIYEYIRWISIVSEIVQEYTVMLKEGNQSYILTIPLKPFQIFSLPRRIHILSFIIHQLEIYH